MLSTTDIIRAGLKRRYAKERRFKLYGLLAVTTGFLFLLILLINITANGWPAFQQTYVKLDVTLDADVLKVNAEASPQELFRAPYAKIIRNSLYSMFPEATSRQDKRLLKQLVSGDAAYALRDKVIADPSLIGTTQSYWFLAEDDVDVFMKGNIDRTLPESDRRLKDRQFVWIDALLAEGRLEKHFNSVFFTKADSREPEQAGILGALMGSLLTMLVTMSLAFPIGVLTAIYLEEFAPQNNPLVDLIEININNLAAGTIDCVWFIRFGGVY